MSEEEEEEEGGRAYGRQVGRVLLGPFTLTLSSPLPAPRVWTLKSATSFTLTPFGWRPRPLARQALGLQAGGREDGEGRDWLYWEVMRNTSKHTR